MLKSTLLALFLYSTIMKATSSSKHSNVISLLQQGYSLRQIAQKTGLGKSTVGRIHQNWDGDKENNRGGRPAKLSTRDKQRIIHKITSGQLDNAVQATHFINHISTTSINPQTVRNVLKENGFKAVVKKKVPLLKKTHRLKRLKFAQEHENWTVEDWKRVLWSDETKVNRIHSDGKVYTWKEKGEGLTDRVTTPTVKHGGGNNLMVWGCMGWNGVGKLVEVVGKMDAEQYCEILDEGVVESFEKLRMKEGERVFQQDNDPKHTSKRAESWFEDNEIEKLVWPPQSPDLNPIEHLWTHLKDQLKLYPTHPKGVHELWDRLDEQWNKIPPKECQKLIESMPRRMKAVIKAKGGHTKY